MRRVSTSFELIVSATFLFLGLYMVYEGSLNKSSSDPAMLVVGAGCFSLSLVALGVAVRSILWHRAMLQHATAANEKVGRRQLEVGTPMCAGQKQLLNKVADALLTLEYLKIPFRGPFLSPYKKNIIYVVDGCILTESEVVVLHEGGHLTAGNMDRLLSDLKRLRWMHPWRLNQ